MSLKARINEDMKAAMRGGEKLRLSTIRMLMAAVKQREVDDRREMTDADVLQIVDKLIKQRREAATQFGGAGRADLEAKEIEEAGILAAYLPEQLSEGEIEALVSDAIAGTSATTVKDMGRVMNFLRPKVQGRADMSQVSNIVKARLTS